MQHVFCLFRKSCFLLIETEQKIICVHRGGSWAGEGLVGMWMEHTVLEAVSDLFFLVVIARRIYIYIYIERLYLKEKERKIYHIHPT